MSMLSQQQKHVPMYVVVLCVQDEPSNRVDSRARVSSLRDVMARSDVMIDAYLIPYEDEHIVRRASSKLCIIADLGA